MASALLRHSRSRLAQSACALTEVAINCGPSGGPQSCSGVQHQAFRGLQLFDVRPEIACRALHLARDLNVHLSACLHIGLVSDAYTLLVSVCCSQVFNKEKAEARRKEIQVRGS